MFENRVPTLFIQHQPELRLKKKYMQTMLDSYHQYIGCFRGTDNEDSGYVISLGTNLPGDVVGITAFKKTYELGLNL